MLYYRCRTDVIISYINLVLQKILLRSDKGCEVTLYLPSHAYLVIISEGI